MDYEMYFDLVDFQYNDIDSVLDAMKGIGIHRIAVSSQAFMETGNPADNRLPPLDLDGEKRVLERPFPDGSHVKYGRRYLPFEPDLSLFKNTTYKPSSSMIPSGKIPCDVLENVFRKAKDKGISVTISIPSEKVSGHIDDYPIDPFGKEHIPQISGKGCINSGNVLNYYIAMSSEIVKRYHPDRIMLDWVEYTNYFFSDNLICFCPDCEKKAIGHGFDFEKMRNSASKVFSSIASMDNVPDADGKGWMEIWESLSPGISELFRFKTQSCMDFVSAIRASLDAIGAYDTGIQISCFAPPMNIGTGLDYAKLASISPTIEIQPKIYRFHWALMTKWYAEELAGINGKISPDRWLPFVKSMLGVTDSSDSISHYNMPGPDEIGAIDYQSELEKISEIERLGQTGVTYRIHGYGPEELFSRRISRANAGSISMCSVQRYGYLSDNKLAMLHRSI